MVTQTLASKDVLRFFVVKYPPNKGTLERSVEESMRGLFNP